MHQLDDLIFDITLGKRKVTSLITVKTDVCHTSLYKGVTIEVVQINDIDQIAFVKAGPVTVELPYSTIINFSHTL